jgi:hypothetical protein
MQLAWQPPGVAAPAIIPPAALIPPSRRGIDAPAPAKTLFLQQNAPTIF